MSLAPAVAVVALSARPMAESLARAGVRVIALDAFGDADTRAAAEHWLPLGRSDAIALDLGRLPDALAALAREAGVVGWVAGSGFEGHESMLRPQGGVPLLGNPAEVVARVRDARHFFAVLDAAGLAHPEVRFEPPADTRGWLAKDFGSAGGFGVRRAGPRGAHAAAGSQRYWQRELPGPSVSALFIAGGGAATVVGCSEQQTVSLGAHPFVFAGAIGPVELPAAQATLLHGAVAHLAAHFGLVGLCSLDAVLGDDGLQLLELNPRPSATQLLYDDCVEDGLMQAHLRACRAGGPIELALRPSQAPERWRGLRIVYAPRAARLDAAGLAALQRNAACHDRPAAALALAAGQPVCSVEARAAEREPLLARLQAEADAVIQSLRHPTHETPA